MVSITLSVPEEVKRRMERFEWLNWSAVAREVFVKRMKRLEILQKFERDFEKGELSDEECIKLGRELKKAMLEKKKNTK